MLEDERFLKNFFEMNSWLGNEIFMKSFVLLSFFLLKYIGLIGEYLYLIGLDFMNWDY